MYYSDDSLSRNAIRYRGRDLLARQIPEELVVSYTAFIVGNDIVYNRCVRSNLARLDIFVRRDKRRQVAATLRCVVKRERSRRDYVRAAVLTPTASSGPPTPRPRRYVRVRRGDAARPRCTPTTRSKPLDDQSGVFSYLLVHELVAVSLHDLHELHC